MANPELIRFGKAVRARRLALGLSQEELADRAGLDRTYVSGVERGRRNITLLNIHALARALETSPAALLKGSRSADMEGRGPASRLGGKAPGTSRRTRSHHE
ncbi:MAG: helix-turn-helix domain-containing protein [Candidatus Methylomirabilales bacterium]